MTVIIGGRQSILNQIPEELRNKFPRLSKPLDSDECNAMLHQCLEALHDPGLGGSATLFTDITRLIIALQLSVSESQFKTSAVLQKD